MDEHRKFIDDNIGDFFEGALECALWTGSYYADDEYGDSDANLEEFDSSDIEPATIAALREDCEGFLAYLASRDKLAALELSEQPAQAGHDFILTRNGEGAGFWDGDWENGDSLTECAKTYGTFGLVMWGEGPITHHG